MQKDSLQNRNGVVKTIAEWEAEENKVVVEEVKEEVVEEVKAVVEKPKRKKKK